MKNKVIIKGNKFGITIVLDPDIEFSELLEEIKNRLKATDNFFDSGKQIAASFEGRELTNEELDNILNVISDNSKLNIQYIIDEDGRTEKLFYDNISSDNASVNNLINNDTTDYYNEEDTNTNDSYFETHDNITESKSVGMFYKGTLRSGQKLETDDSIVIIGDVNPGASVIAGGNIVIIGSLTGCNYNYFTH